MQKLWFLWNNENFATFFFACHSEVKGTLVLKNFSGDFNRIRSPGLCDAGAVLLLTEL